MHSINTLGPGYSNKFKGAGKPVPSKLIYNRVESPLMEGGGRRYPLAGGTSPVKGLSWDEDSLASMRNLHCGSANIPASSTKTIAIRR